MSLYVEGPMSFQTRTDYAPTRNCIMPIWPRRLPNREPGGTYNYTVLWFSMSMEVTTYMLASSPIAGGMNWKQKTARSLGAI